MNSLKNRVDLANQLSSVVGEDAAYEIAGGLRTEHIPAVTASLSANQAQPEQQEATTAVLDAVESSDTSDAETEALED